MFHYPQRQLCASSYDRSLHFHLCWYGYLSFIKNLISLQFSILFTRRRTRTFHLLCGSIPSYPQRDGNVLGGCNLFILGCSIVNNIPSNAGSYGSWRRLVHPFSCVTFSSCWFYFQLLDSMPASTSWHSCWSSSFYLVRFCMLDRHSSNLHCYCRNQATHSRGTWLCLRCTNI